MADLANRVNAWMASSCQWTSFSKHTEFHKHTELYFTNTEEYYIITFRLWGIFFFKQAVISSCTTDIFTHHIWSHCSETKGPLSRQLTCSLGKEADLRCPEEVQEKPTSHPGPRLSIWVPTGYGRWDTDVGHLPRTSQDTLSGLERFYFTAPF